MQDKIRTQWWLISYSKGIKLNLFEMRVRYQVNTDDGIKTALKSGNVDQH
jgi:hypothetical protein